MTEKLVVPSDAHRNVVEAARSYLVVARQMKLLYIGGRITPPEDAACRRAILEANVSIAVAAFFEASRKGWAVHCPHPLALWGAELEWWAQYGVVMPCDITFIEKADAVLLLPGWEDSHGCQIEKRVADELEKPIYYSIEELPNLRGPEE